MTFSSNHLRLELMNLFDKIPAWMTRSVLIAAALCLVGSSGWYSPYIAASLWRVFHPKGWVNYRGLYVKVPWPWIADPAGSKDEETSTPQGMGLRRMPQTIFQHLPPQSIFITVISPDPGVTAEQQTSRWLEMFRQTHTGPVSPENTAEIPAGASCLTADNPSNPLNVVWTCISVNGGWVATLEGRRTDEPVFLEVIAGLKRK